MTQTRTSTGKIRSGYTSRAERIADGSLVDASKQARAYRFLVPVALTKNLHEDVRDLSGDYVLSGDTAESRLQSLLHYARANASYHLGESGFSFSFYMPVADQTTYHVRLSLHAANSAINSATPVWSRGLQKSSLKRAFDRSFICGTWLELG